MDEDGGTFIYEDRNEDEASVSRSPSEAESSPGEESDDISNEGGHDTNENEVEVHHRYNNNEDPLLMKGSGLRNRRKSTVVKFLDRIVRFKGNNNTTTTTVTTTTTTNNKEGRLEEFHDRSDVTSMDTKISQPVIQQKQNRLGLNSTEDYYINLLSSSPQTFSQTSTLSCTNLDEETPPTIKDSLTDCLVTNHESISEQTQYEDPDISGFQGFINSFKKLRQRPTIKSSFVLNVPDVDTDVTIQVFCRRSANSN